MGVTSALLGILGFFGTIRGRDGKKHLRVYLVTFIIIFLTHGACINVIGYNTTKIKLQLTENINKLAIEISSSNTPPVNSCTLMRSVSKFFECCDAGVNKQCCMSKNEKPCAETIVNSIRSNKITVLVIFSSVLLTEFVITLIITYMLGSVNYESRDFKKRRSSMYSNYNRNSVLWAGKFWFQYFFFFEWKISL